MGLKIRDLSTFCFSLLIINPQDLQVPSEEGPFTTEGFIL